MAAKAHVLSLYRSLLKESRKFPTYNFKSYAVRRIRDAFKENKNLTDPEKISQSLKFAEENLAVVKRQVKIGELYATDKLIIEK